MQCVEENLVSYIRNYMRDHGGTAPNWRPLQLKAIDIWKTIVKREDSDTKQTLDFKASNGWLNNVLKKINKPT